MLKVVLDTSILVSAFLKHEGVNAKILHGGKRRIYVKSGGQPLALDKNEIIRKGNGSIFLRPIGNNQVRPHCLLC